MNFFRKTDKVANADGNPSGGAASAAAGDDLKTNAAVVDEVNTIATCNDSAASVAVANAGAVAGAADGAVAGTATSSPVAEDAAAAAVSGDAADAVAEVVTSAKDNDDEEEGAPMSNIPLNSSQDHDDDDEHSDDEHNDGVEHSEHSDNEHDEEESEGEYTDDDDSEYTYETVEEEDEKKKGGWFGFLRRKKHAAEDEEEHSDSEEEHSGSESEEEDEHTDEADDANKKNEAEDEENESSDDEQAGTHHLLNSPTTPSKPTSSASTLQQEEEEAILMAQAIQRVQHRIQSNGGNLYNALDEKDRRLVDSLRGVQDESRIREVVNECMERDELKKVDEGKKEEEKVEDAGVENEVEPSLHTEPKLDTEPSVPAKETMVEPSLHDEPSVVSEPTVTEAKKVDKPLTVDESPEHLKQEGDNLVNTEEADGSHIEPEEKDNEDEDDDDEQPTLEEQRSLLSLAAEHDRVDVIQELLQNETLHKTLLDGVDGSTTQFNLSTPPKEQQTNDSKNDTKNGTEANGEASLQFVPPPLHAAIAHGSFNAASCLLRMGADPSLRPVVPSAYLARSYQPPIKRSGSQGGGMEEDRNYRKYHDMSAWELAFGSVEVLEEGDDDEEQVVEEEVKEEETPRGWFGFGTPKKQEKEASNSTEETANLDNTNKAGGKQRIKRKYPLNIPQQKLEGIRHAFTAEALRAIGSDEVDRLAQLVNAGMDKSMEVAGKTLGEWAVEMDARGCCELLGLGMEDDVEQEVSGTDAQEEEGADVVHDDQTNGGEHSDNSKEGADQPTPTDNAIPESAPTIIQDERLTGLSLTDIQMLTRETLKLLPHLTSVRDDLASETSICQSILRDVQATGGRGGLSSQSLLELVRSLKERRAQAEEATQAWQNAWEEREDELDFFWEEVLDENMRAELGGLLDAVMLGDNDPRSASNTLEECAAHFIEVDNRVNALRASINSLAEESAKYSAEIERLGMSGALSLTQSLREEVKEMEKTLNEAKMGEALCRRKIEIIQQRLGAGSNGEAEERPMQQGHMGEPQEEYVNKSSMMQAQGAEVENHQQNAKDQQQMEQQPESGKEMIVSSQPPPAEHEQHLVDQAKIPAVPVQQKGSSPESEHEEVKAMIGEETATEALADNLDADEDSDYASEPDGVDEATEHSVDETKDIIKVQSVDDDPEENDESNDIIDEEVMLPRPKETNIQEEESGASEVAAAQEPRPSVAETTEGTFSSPDKTVVNGIGNAPLKSDESNIAATPAAADSQELPQESAPRPTTNASTSTNDDAKKPSDAIAKGMSTAIVVHTPNNQRGSIPSQIWEILRRIVGLSRVAPERSSSYHDAENHPHIMIV